MGAELPSSARGWGVTMMHMYMMYMMYMLYLVQLVYMG